MTSAPNPFVVHRHQLDLYRLARDRGLDDAAYVALVERADERVAAVAGTGFGISPLLDLTGSRPELAALGPVVAKVETAGVAGSHKARHLFGLLLHHLIADGERGPGPGTAGRSDRPLAIASCGNGALGAAVVAASAQRRLLVFVPVEANPKVVTQLQGLGAEVRFCPRQPGRPGDPCDHELRAALAGGAEAFTVQGTLCPTVIDGARTLGLELAHQLDQRGLTAVDVFIQVGGGALATAVMDGLARSPAWSSRSGAGPRLHPVQARAAHPYVAGWHRIAPALLRRLGQPDPLDDRARAATLAATVGAAAGLPDELAACAHLMTPWPAPPHSIATGILDDLSYDWPTVMAHQIRSGGWPQLVDEATLAEAATLASAVLVDAGLPPTDATGAAGLAGLMVAARDGTLPRRAGGEVAVVLLTGVDRDWPAPDNLDL